MPPFGPPGSFLLPERPVVLRGKRCGLAMAETRAELRAREIFTTLDYGPVPESYACALVRASGRRCPLPSPGLAAASSARTPVIHRGRNAAPPLSAPGTPATGQDRAAATALSSVLMIPSGSRAPRS